MPIEVCPSAVFTEALRATVPTLPLPLMLLLLLLFDCKHVERGGKCHRTQKQLLLPRALGALWQSDALHLRLHSPSYPPPSSRISDKSDLPQSTAWQRVEQEVGKRKTAKKGLRYVRRSANSRRLAWQELGRRTNWTDFYGTPKIVTNVIFILMFLTRYTLT